MKNKHTISQRAAMKPKGYILSMSLECGLLVRHLELLNKDFDDGVLDKVYYKTSDLPEIRKRIDKLNQLTEALEKNFYSL